LSVMVNGQLHGERLLTNEALADATLICGEIVQVLRNFGAYLS
jgi:hypothetical protein